jgi:hypothetical protein
MWRFRRKGDGGTATADLPPEMTIEWDGTTGELWQEIERLREAQRRDPDPDTARRLLRLRHLAGLRVIDEARNEADFAAPAAGALPADRLPELTRADVTPGLLRAGILRDGCVLVRGLIERDAAVAFAERIDRAFAEREHDEPADGYYEEFVPNLRARGVLGRDWIKDGGGVLAADSPTVAFEMFELFRTADLAALVDGYLGEPALVSVHKTTLRKASPAVPGAWHQDGSFMGDVRSLNLWLSLSRCGDVAPGLDIVPRRLDHLVARQTEEAMLDIQVSQSKAEEAAGEAGIVRPIFEPGDALFFDELFLHQTASDPSMPNPRYAIENWFFGASAFPEDYAPVAPW